MRRVSAEPLAGPELAAQLQVIVRQVGPYPHRAILAA